VPSAGAAAPAVVPLAARRAGSRTGTRTGVPRWRAALRSPVVAAVGAVAVLAGGGAAAAANWLPIFRTEQVVAVDVTETDLVDLPDLSALGTVEVLQEPQVREVADAAAAEAETGLTVPTLAALPGGIADGPTYQVGDEVTAVLTFSAERVAEAVAAGADLPTPPAGLDGSQFRITAGPGVAAVWADGRGVPSLVVGRAGAPTVDSSGVPFATARDYVLSLPGLPEDLATQLRAFSADGSTLPLPVPAGSVDTDTTEVDGAPATVFTTRDGLMAGVVWVEDGTLTAVAGTLSDDEVLDVARGLR
uniref:hypothetical protein n=1 Tax=Cellulomonas endophytica TaxID=2494735 RepID=UPI0013E91478